jgi:C-terminal processing protease CtpA/Prc
VRAFLGLAGDQGLYVQSIVEGSLAAELGIEAGDILLEIAGQQIGAVGDVRNALSSVEVGAKVDVVVNRRGARKQLTATKQTVELAEPKDRSEQPEPVSEPQEPAPPPQPEPGEGAKSGGKLRRIR